MSMMYYQ